MQTLLGADPLGLGSLQHAHAHSDQRAELLPFVDGDVPNDPPREDGKHNIHRAGIDWDGG